MADDLVSEERVEVGIGDHRDVFDRAAERRRVGQLDGVARQIGGEGEEIEVPDVFLDDAFSDDLPPALMADGVGQLLVTDRKSTRLNSSHVRISYAVFCLKKKKRFGLVA